MQVIERGHIYKPEMRLVDRPHKDSAIIAGAEQTITFINKQPGQEHDGTTTQEVIRILLDRTRHCANCMPHPVNERIIYHLRMALVLHESRALERKTEKGYFEPEYLAVGGDGHFDIDSIGARDALHTTQLLPHKMDWEKTPNHPIAE